MKWTAAAITCLFLSVFGARDVYAQNGPVVVELFTSQGCSSCPPADALMHKLAKRDNVIALSVHVDYWDYIGWKDAFASPDHSARQRAYAIRGQRRSVYTPQMIIGGVDSVVGTYPMDVADLIAKHAAAPDPVQVNVTRNGASIEISARAQAPARYDVVLARFSPRQTVDIKRGENAGRTLSYVNVVSKIEKIGSWDGRAPLSASVQAGSGPFAIFIQREDHGPIDGAAIVR